MPEEDMWRILTQVMAPNPLRHGESVSDLDHPCGRIERRDQDQGAVLISSGDTHPIRRGNRKMSTAVVEDPGENRRAVEPRKTPPFDRATKID
jgi:hypothetical protein